MKIDLKILKTSETAQFESLISIFHTAFNMQPDEEASTAHLHKLLRRDSFLVMVATADDEVIGGLTIYLLDQYYSEKPLAYIYDFAIMEKYQRKGIGKQLMDFANAYCKKIGAQEAYVEAGQADINAVSFYRATKPSKEEEVLHFSYDLENDQT
ncbi:GNAT family N-acetyltransferase [Albibacterium indicum]|uniref:GNAT family N-acetyltransferase n=1 Tax=Albibacterium indicum TaxID=2292082 RepID=UPI000E4C4F3B|nr:GNAT family N-acetyltransferase [Pedobacter indicus]